MNRFMRILITIFGGVGRYWRYFLLNITHFAFTKSLAVLKINYDCALRMKSKLKNKLKYGTERPTCHNFKIVLNGNYEF